MGSHESSISCWDSSVNEGSNLTAPTRKADTRLRLAYALSTDVPRNTGCYAEKLYITLRCQFPCRNGPGVWVPVVYFCVVFVFFCSYFSCLSVCHLSRDMQNQQIDCAPSEDTDQPGPKVSSCGQRRL